MSTDSDHEYKWCPASNRIGVTSCGVTQITKARLVANKPLESYAWSQLRCQRHSDHDKFQLCDDKETCIHHELGRQDRICSQAKKTSLQPPRAHFLTTRPHSPVDETGPDNKSSQIDVTESTGLDGTQTCGNLSLMPGTSPERAKLGRATCSSTHVAH